MVGRRDRTALAQPSRVLRVLEKPAFEQIELFLEKIRGMLARAGRTDHAQCAALVVRRRAAGEAEVPLVLRGKVETTGRSTVEVNAVTRDMQHSCFAVLARSVVARERAIDAWSSRSALGLGESRSATSRLREPFEGLAPEGFEVFEGDRKGSFRLNPRVVVAEVDWDALAEHPDPGVARVAAEQRKRRAGSRRG